jgi:hypothetical protein
MLVHPPLRPAFRVRRGRRAAGVDTTRHDGSRASGYPPDFVSFRRRAGALSAGAARRHRSLGRSRPPSLWGALFGNATKSAGCAKRGEGFHKAQTGHDGQQRRRARPYDMLRPRSGCSQRTGAETVARSWAIERNELGGLTRPRFYLVIFELRFSRFCKIDNQVFAGLRSLLDRFSAGTLSASFAARLRFFIRWEVCKIALQFGHPTSKSTSIARRSYNKISSPHLGHDTPTRTRVIEHCSAPAQIKLQASTGYRISIVLFQAVNGWGSLTSLPR